MTNTSFEKNFSLLVRRERGSLTQAEYSKLLGVARVTVANWERGKITDLPTLARLAHTGGKGRILVQAIFSLILNGQVEGVQVFLAVAEIGVLRRFRREGLRFVAVEAELGLGLFEPGEPFQGQVGGEEPREFRGVRVVTLPAAVVQGGVHHHVVKAAVMALEAELPPGGDEQASVLGAVGTVAGGALPVRDGGVNRSASGHLVVTFVAERLRSGHQQAAVVGAVGVMAGGALSVLHGGWREPLPVISSWHW